MHSESNVAEPPLLCVRDLCTWFPIKGGVFSRTVGYVKAVNGVSFNIDRGKTLGLVGGTGCGKTTVGRSILRLIPASSGETYFRNTNPLSCRASQLRNLRRHIQIVFQDPVGSLNPRLSIGEMIGEPIEVHGIARGRQRDELVASLLHRVGMEPAHASHYAHEFSGGQRQRIGIARALALSPDFIVCDEPVSALDVSIQSQILNLLMDLQVERGIAFLFIAHNLAVVQHVSDHVAVMYLGRVVEHAPTEEMYANPKHPYTLSLLSAIPSSDPRRARRRMILTGDVPSPASPPSGCSFHLRCPLTRDLAAHASASETHEISSAGEKSRVMCRCVHESPTLQSLTGHCHHQVSCWFAQ